MSSSSPYLSTYLKIPDITTLLERLDARDQLPAFDDPVAQEEGYIDPGPCYGRLRDCAIGVPENLSEGMPVAHAV